MNQRAQELQLAQVARLYAATGDGFARLTESGDVWKVELSLVGSGLLAGL